MRLVRADESGSGKEIISGKQRCYESGKAAAGYLVDSSIQHIITTTWNHLFQRQNIPTIYSALQSAAYTPWVI